MINLLKTYGFIIRTIIGANYGGPFGGLLLGSITTAMINLLKTYGFIIGTIIGANYGGPFGGLLLGSITTAGIESIIEAVKINSLASMKERWLNFIETLNPFSNSICKYGPGYRMFSHLATVFCIIASSCGVNYFSPILEPYFFSFISKPIQKIASEFICSQVIAKISGAAVDQSIPGFQQMVFLERDKKIKVTGLQLSPSAQVDQEHTR